MTLQTVAAIALVVVIAALPQRIAGMGLGLLAAPPLVLLLGPGDGVMLVNVCGAVASLVMIARLRREIRILTVLPLAVTGALGVIAGTAVAATVPVDVFQVGVGVIVLAALGLTLVRPRREPRGGNAVVLAAVGAASGVMGATAGLSGPLVAVYAASAGWSGQRLRSTLQPFFLTTASSALVAKSVAAGGVPQTVLLLVPVVVVAVLIGLLIGEPLARRMSPDRVRAAVLVLSAVGALATVVDGLISLAGG